MALIELSAPLPFVSGRRTYVRAPKPIHFPSEEPWEEKVGETKRHLEVRTCLYLLLKDAFGASAIIGSDQFVYFDATSPRRCLSPDVFVQLHRPNEMFDVWKTWVRGAPDLAVEIVSPSDRRDDDWDEKMERYQASGIREIVRFDGESRTDRVRVWDRIEEDLVERAPGSSRLLECETLGLWWVVVPSPVGPFLRLARNRDGTDLLPTPDERIAAAKEAQERAEQDRMRAEQDRDRVHQDLRDRDAIIAQLKAELDRARAGQR